MSPARQRGVALAGSVAAACFAAVAMLLTWLALMGGAGTQGQCNETAAVAPLGRGPQQLRPLFAAAAFHYRLGGRGPSILAGLTSVESGFGTNMGPSSAGAVGWTQFMPTTWARYGVDADGDGRADPFTAADAIFTAARYLRANGAPADWYRALFAYNHADWYVTEVLQRAARLASVASLPPNAAACPSTPSAEPAGIERVVPGGRLVGIPSAPGQRVDARILADVEYLVRRYRLTITAAYAATGHAPGGEHPLGLAIDVVPGPGGSWDEVDRLARWAEPLPAAPRPPFRWVGYDGDPGHGRGNHLHLSWNHGQSHRHRPPAAWVDTFIIEEQSA
jgi:hypothetical protein